MIGYRVENVPPTLVKGDPVFVDLQFPVSSGKVPAANFPSYETFTPNTKQYAFGVGENIDLQANEPHHGWFQGSLVYIHAHIAPKTANNSGSPQYFNLQVIFAAANVGSVYTETTVSGELVIPNGTAAITHLLLPVDTFTPTITIGSQITPHITRIAAVSGTEYADDMFITQVGFHIQLTRMGSLTIVNQG